MRIDLGSGLLLVALAASACASHPVPPHAGGSNAAAPSAGGVGVPNAVRSPADIAASATPAIVTVRAGNSLGTGFIVRADGWVATNFHVVRGASEIVITLPDQRQLQVVEIINANRLRDLVILRVEAHDLPVLRVGNSDQVRAGDAVLAIGHPLGLEDTVSNGLISAVRHVHAGLDVLQVSAPIAPGSSGSPLFNDRGEVIGVATAILNGGQNLNFGLPSNYVRDMVEHPRPISMALFTAAMAMIQSRAEAHQPTRDIPHYALTALSGCTDAQKILTAQSLQEAIEVGAPLYNDGKVAACYHVYEGAAADLVQRLPAACAGLKRALSDGQHRAAQLASPNAQAWAMRDSFDGVLELLARSLPEKQP